MDKQLFERHFDYAKMVFKPDLIIGHSGFGNTLYLKEVWPNAKFVGYFEWFYRSQGSDVGFGTINLQVLTPACGFTPTTARS